MNQSVESNLGNISISDADVKLETSLSASIPDECFLENESIGSSTNEVNNSEDATLLDSKEESCVADGSKKIKQEKKQGITSRRGPKRGSKFNTGNYLCEHCNKRYTSVANKKKHLEKVHNITVQSKVPNCYAKCVECQHLRFTTVQNFRNHLEKVHDLNMKIETMTFPNLNAFHKWKNETERRDVASYVLRNGTRNHPNGPKYTFVCHRSGRHYLKRDESKRQRITKMIGSCKLGITCTSSISVHEQKNLVYVKYCPHHYGHGKDTFYVQLSKQEQTAIQENMSSGMPIESLMDDIRETASDKDSFQLHLLKKKDTQFIKTVLKSQDFIPRLSDADNVEHWVNICCEMENPPVLLFQPEDKGFPFTLIIMTEFQKHILQSSPKRIACIDSLYRKGCQFYLTILYIIDDQESAFPVAFCISGKNGKDAMMQFLEVVKESAGSLTVECLMSDSDLFYYEAWQQVMLDSPRWLWSTWWIDHKVRMQLKCYKNDITRKTEVYKSMRNLLECQNRIVFHSMLNNFLETLRNDPLSTNMLSYIESKVSDNFEMWAYCYRKEFNLSINVHLECLHWTFRYLCREGRKKRLDKFIFILMKLLRHKMIDRLMYAMDDEKTQLAVETIDMYHGLGVDIPTQHISSISDRMWIVRAEDEEELYITKEFDTCPQHCSLRCAKCDVCVHTFSCSCLTSLIDANLCQHIHAVVWKLLTPHFSPPNSPVADSGLPDYDSDDTRSASSPVSRSVCSSLMDRVLDKAHKVFNMVKNNRHTLTRESLLSISERLNDCLDIGSGKIIPSKPSTNEILESKSPVQSSRSTSISEKPKETAPTLIYGPEFISNKPKLVFDSANSQYYLIMPDENTMS